MSFLKLILPFFLLASANAGRFYVGLDLGHSTMSLLESAQGIDRNLPALDKTEHRRKRKELTYFPSIGYEHRMEDYLVGVEAYASTFSTLFNATVSSKEGEQLFGRRTNTKHLFKKEFNLGAKAKIGHFLSDKVAIYYAVGLDYANYTDTVQGNDMNGTLINSSSVPYNLFTVSHTFGVSKKISDNLTIRAEYMFLKPRDFFTDHVLSENVNYHSFIKNVNFSVLKAGLTYSF